MYSYMYFKTMFILQISGCKFACVMILEHFYVFNASTMQVDSLDIGPQFQFDRFFSDQIGLQCHTAA